MEAHPVICECCLKNSNKTQFDQDTDPGEFADINIGFSLFFKMLALIKHAVWRLALVLGGVTLLDFAGRHFASRDPWHLMALWECLGHSAQGLAGAVVDAGVFASSVVFVLWLRHRLNRYHQTLQEEAPPLISDFSVFVGNLPRGQSLIDLKLDLEAFFRNLNHNNGLSYSLVDCSFCLYAEDFLDLRRESRSLKNAIYNLEEELATSSSANARLGILKWGSQTQALDSVSRRLGRLRQEFYEILVEGKPSARFTGKAFLVFDCKHSVDDLLDRYSSRGWGLGRLSLWAKSLAHRLRLRLSAGSESESEPAPARDSLLNRKQEFFLSNRRLYRFRHSRPRASLEYGGSVLKVSPSMHPSNVNWDYFGVSRAKKLLIRFGMATLAWAILLAGFLIVLKFYFFRKKFQLQFPERSLPKLVLAKTLSLAVSLVVCGINQFTVFVTRLASRLEYHKKKTHRMVRELEKMLFRMFCNASVCTFLISFDIQAPRDRLAPNGGLFDPSPTFGLIYEQFRIDRRFLLAQTVSLFVVSCALFPLLVVFDPYYLAKSYTIARVKRERKIDIDQRSLNKVFELPEFDLISNSTSVLYMLFTGSLYAPFFPVLSMGCLIVFFSAQGFLLKKYFLKR